MIHIICVRNCISNVRNPTLSEIHQAQTLFLPKIFSRNWSYIMIFSCFCRYVNNSRRFEGWSKQSTQTRRLSPECHDNRDSGLDCHWAWVTVGKGVIWQKSNISLLKRSYKSKDLYIIEFRGHDILSALHLCPYSLLFKVFCCITWLIIVVSVKRSQARLKLPRTHANTNIRSNPLTWSWPPRVTLHVIIMVRVVLWWLAALPGQITVWSQDNDTPLDRLLLLIKDGQTKHCISIQNEIWWSCSVVSLKYRQLLLLSL